MKYSLVPVLIWFYLKAVLSQTPLEDRCPEPEDIQPCTCGKSYGGLRAITCQNVYTADTLRTSFRNAERYFYNYIIIESSTLQYIPHEIIEKSHATGLVLSNSILIQVFDSPPQAAYTFTEISLKNVRVSRDIISWEFFQGFVNVTSFTVRRTPIAFIGPTFSKYMSKKLEWMEFSDAIIRKLKPGALSELSNLRNVVLTNCSITNLSRDMFPRPWTVTRLWLGDNNITTIAGDLFTDMNVDYMSLDNSNISVLPESAFQRSNVKQLALGGNPWSCDCRMKWLLKGELIKSYGDGICASPPDLKGKLVEDLTASDFHCRSNSLANFT